MSYGNETRGVIVNLDEDEYNKGQVEDVEVLDEDGKERWMPITEIKYVNKTSKNISDIEYDIDDFVEYIQIDRSYYLSIEMYDEICSFDYGECGTVQEINNDYYHVNVGDTTTYDVPEAAVTEN